MLTAAFAVVGQVGVGPVPISARGSRNGEGIEARSAGAAIAGLAKELAAAIPGSKGVNSKFASSSKRNQGRATLPRDRRESEAGLGQAP